MDEATSSARSWLWYGAGLLVFIALALALYLFYHHHAPRNPYANTTVNSVLREFNPDFSNGVLELSQHNYADARVSFQNALTKATDEAQIAVIKYNLGSAYAGLGQYADAIAAYKAAVADAQARPITRAYAVWAIGTLRYAHFDALPLIMKETFVGDPYASFLQGDNYYIAYTKLFEYAASFYPIAPAEAFLSYAYANDLQALGGATTTTDGAAYVREMDVAFAAVQSDLPRLSKSEGEIWYLPGTLAREAIAQWPLVQYGVPGYTREQIEPLYTKALTYAATSGEPDGNFIAWEYAIFLDRAYGTSRNADIKKVLAPFAVNAPENTIDPLVIAFFKELPANSTLTLEKVLTVHLAAVDVAFKAYLLSLGWHESDFTGHY